MSANSNNNKQRSSRQNTSPASKKRTTATIEGKAREVEVRDVAKAASPTDPKSPDKAPVKSSGAIGGGDINPATGKSTAPSMAKSSSSTAKSSGAAQQDDGKGSHKAATVPTAGKAATAGGKEDKSASGARAGTAGEKSASGGGSHDTRKPSSAGGMAGRDPEKDKPGKAAMDKKSAPASPPPSAKGGKSAGGSGSYIGYGASALIGALLALFAAQPLSDVSKKWLGVGLVQGGGASHEALNRIASRLAKLEAGAGAEGKKVEAKLASRIDALDKSVSELAAISKAVASIESTNKATAKELAALEGRLAKLSSADGVAGETAKLGGRVGKIEDMLKTLAADGKSGRDKSAVARLAALSGKINDFQVAFDSKIAALKKAAKRDVAAQIAAVAAKINALGKADSATLEAIASNKAGIKRLGVDLETGKTDVARLAQKIQTIEIDRQRLEQSLEAAKKRSEEVAKAIAALQVRLTGAIKPLAKADDVKAAVAPVAKKLGTIEGELKGVISREKTRQESAKRILLGLELTNLKRTVARGEPYGPQLKQVLALAPKSVDLSALKASAAEGAATTAELQGEFKALLPEILAAGEEKKSKSWTDSITSGLKSIVRVRKTGNVAGSGTEAVVARMEFALKDGDLARAASEAATLKGKAKAVVEPWLAKLKARLAIDEAMAKIDAGMKRALAGSEG